MSLIPWLFDSYNIQFVINAWDETGILMLIQRDLTGIRSEIKLTGSNRNYNYMRRFSIPYLEDDCISKLFVAGDGKLVSRWALADFRNSSINNNCRYVTKRYKISERGDKINYKVSYGAADISLR